MIPFLFSSCSSVEQKNEKPNIKDFETHLATIFKEVRLKKYIEIRSLDTCEWDCHCGGPAFYTGLIYGNLDGKGITQGATINYARGTGIRDRMGLLGVTIDEQKEIIRIIVSKEQSNRVFESMFLAGELDTPGKGIMWMVKLDRVATHIPKDVMKRAKGQK